MEELQKKLKEYSPYLEDLFNRIHSLTLFFIVAFLAGFFLSAPLLRFLTDFFNFTDVTLAASSPFQFVDLAMNMGIFTATLLSLPVFLYHVYAFIGTALRKGEKKLFFFILPIGLLLFLLGFAYGFSILYITMQTLANINVGLGITNVWDISTFLSQIISTSALLGLIFEFPILLTVLIKMGLIKVDFLKKKRRYVIFGICVCTSLLPPTDGISLLMMVVPLIIMYEVTIIYNRFSYTN